MAPPMGGDGNGDAGEFGDAVGRLPGVDGGEAVDGEDGDGAEWHPSADVGEKSGVLHRIPYDERKSSQGDGDRDGHGECGGDVGEVRHCRFLSAVDGERWGWR